MQIDIRNEFKIKDLKTQFHTYFKYLKIEFFKGKHDNAAGSPKDMMLENDTELKTLLDKEMEGSLSFTRDITVNAFEQKLMDKFNLNVQVFRKSGNIYLETTTTDSWTLEQQNKEGELASTLGSRESGNYETNRDQLE